MTMITFEENNKTFVYRVAAVITAPARSSPDVPGERVLLHRAERDPFWSLPGGRVEMMESSMEAIQREMREELGEAVQVERLLWTVENLFTAGGRRYHELGMYYLAHLPEDSRLLEEDGPFYGQEDFYLPGPPLRLVFQWFPLNPDMLQNETIYPVFLRKALIHFPECTEHVLNSDENDS